MALIDCVNCGKPVSDKAPNCPHCGLNPLIDQQQVLREQKKRKIRNIRNIGIGIAGIILIYFIIDFILISTNDCPIFYSAGSSTYEFDKPIEYSESLRNAAENGDPDAQADLGSYYSDLENYSEALKWFQASANQNNPKAKHRLANLYWNGDGVPENKAMAFKLYEEAANSGYATAQYILGGSYLFGNGVEMDENKGMNYLAAAAKQDYAPANFLLGRLLISDEGRPNILGKDVLMGINFLNAAAEQDYAPAYVELGILCDTISGELVGESVLSDVRSNSLSNFEKAAELGYPDAQYYLGMIYKDLGNKVNGMKLLAKAAQQGHEGAIAEYRKRFFIWEW